MIIAFLIWTVLAVIFLCIGIYCRSSRKPVGFWANSQPPKIRDVQKYNYEMSRLWMVYALLFECTGIPFLFLKQNSPVFIIPVLANVFLAIGIMAVYGKIESKYIK
ncbi:MAG: hypothetical protein IKG15_05165 [Solobacterium sp.]|jgi:hypothetical protein|nr:hypothetical protein [Solobacterium sp.]